jgi:hypothetical protein
MPPRFAYWTILIDDKPTAFRARDREELLPTLTQLKRTNANVSMKWYAQGQLWDSPDAQRAARRAPTTFTGEKRGGDWRPGGAHKDPRDRFKKRNRPERAWSETDPSVRRDRDKPGPPSERQSWRDKPAAARPPGRPQSDRPWSAAKPRDPSKPWSGKPRDPSKPWSGKPRDPSKPWSGKPRDPSKPWSGKPRDPSTPWSGKPRDPSKPWSGKPRDPSKPWSGKPRDPSKPWSGKPRDPSKPWTAEARDTARPPGDQPRGPSPPLTVKPAGSKKPWHDRPNDQSRKPFRPHRPKPDERSGGDAPRKREDDD